MEESMLAAAVKGLIAAGPVGTVLGLVCYGLWKKVERLEAVVQTTNDKFIGFLTNALNMKEDRDGDGKPG